MMIRDQVAALLKSALQAVSIDDSPHLTHPSNPDFGDYSTNIALKHAKNKKQSPIELAESILKGIPENDILDKTSQVNGFINLTLKPKTLLHNLHSNDSCTKTNKTILIEFGQPNTHKSPHIGHLFSYIYGESLARILEAAGSKVIRANYQGDIGLHVAKCLWAYRKNMPEIEPATLTEKMSFLQMCYQTGATSYEEQDEAKKEIDQLNIDLYNAEDEELMNLWSTTRNWCVEYYARFEKDLGITYDRSYFETEIASEGKQMVLQNTPNVFRQSDGATIFVGEDFGLHTRVFINRFGNPTYEGKELGLAFQKQEDFAFDHSITTTASEQNEYMKVVYKAIEQIDPALAGKMEHIGYGMITLSSGKMSSRSGNIITAFSLVEDVTREITNTFGSAAEDARAIAFGAIKYAFLKSDAQANKTFDTKTSIAREGDSGPYLMYTYVRTRGILNNETIKHLNDVSENEWGTVIDSYVPQPEEMALLRLLPQLNEVVEQAAETRSPHLIAHFAFEVAQAFNHFYQSCPIAKADTTEQMVRVQMVKQASAVLQLSLRLLGIDTIEKM